MIRFFLMACVVISLCVAGAHAEEPAPFAVTSEATRSGEEISISLKIVENKMQLVPNVGNTNVTTTRAAPRLRIVEGQQATVAIGRTRPVEGAGTQPATLDSGIKVEVISIKGQNKLLVVTTVLEDGVTVWADAATVKVQPKPADKPK